MLISNQYYSYFNGRGSWRDSYGVRHIAVDDISSKAKKFKINKKTKKISPEVSRWISIVSRAKKKQLDCDLELADVKYIIESNCIYCNSSERIEVDRMDSSLGYTKLNTVPACHRCNTIKNNVVTYDEMMTIVDILGWRK